MKDMLQQKRFIYIAEVAAKRLEERSELSQRAKNLLKNFDIVAFSDMAAANPYLRPINETIDLGVFEDLPPERVLPIIATGRKEQKEIDEIIKKLKTQKIKQVFVVTGDVEKPRFKSKQVLSEFSKHFITGAVTHPQVGSINDSLEKIKNGASFLITQASYDFEQWDRWWRFFKKQKIHKKIKLFQVITPITSLKLLGILISLPDISISKEVIHKFESLEPSQTANYGMKLARRLIKKCRSEGFSGVYLYSARNEKLDSLLV